MINRHPISKQLIAKNTLINLMGQVFPFLAAFFSIPIILKEIGTARLGILTLVWAFVGYLSLFDLGIGRALTHEIAKRLPHQVDKKDLSSVVWTSLLFLLILGVAGLVIGVLISKWMTFKILHIPQALQSEALYSFYFLFASLPIVILTTGLRGILQAHQRFDLVNMVQIPFGIFSFVGPLIVIFFSRNLVAIICVLIFIRIIAFIYYCKFSFEVMPYLKHFKIIKIDVMRSMFSYGGWMTVSNIVGPFLYYFDRFFLGAMVSVAAVAYYTTPYEIVTKLWVIPISLSRVLFSAFSTTYKQDLEHTAKLFISGLKYVFIIIFPIVFIIFTFAFEGLELWIGSEFANNSVVVLRFLVIGVFINSLTQVAVNLIQGMGRPDLSAKLHLFELPVYLVCIWYFVKNFGIEGAAMAWLVRVFIDGICLFIMAGQLVSFKKKEVFFMVVLFFMVLLSCYYSLMLSTIITKLYFTVILLLLALFFIWKKVLSDAERLFLKKILMFKFLINKD